MEVFLLKDIDNLGYRHDLISVKDGYGRNYLIPKGLAMIANKPNRAKIDAIKAREAAELAKRLKEFEDLAEQLKDVVLRIGAKAGTSNKIFGSVTNVQISEALKEQQGVDVERRKIEIPEEVKTLGTYTAILNVHPEVDCKVAFEVVQE